MLKLTRIIEIDGFLDAFHEKPGLAKESKFSPAKFPIKLSIIEDFENH
jgi:hypothetical protein